MQFLWLIFSDWNYWLKPNISCKWKNTTSSCCNYRHISAFTLSCSGRQKIIQRDLIWQSNKLTVTDFLFQYGIVINLPWLSIDNWVPHSGMLLYLHHRNSKLFFHPAKFDNFKDEKISDFKTVSVSQSKNLLDWKLVV